MNREWTRREVITMGAGTLLATTMYTPLVRAQDDDRRVRVAKMSFAHVHANGHADEIVNSDRADLTVIWDEDADRGREMADKYGVPFEPDLEACMARDDVDGICCDAPTNIHQDIYLAACAHGKHVVTEKALTIKTKDADAVVKAVHESGIKFTLTLPSRTRPEVLWLRQVVDEGLIGDITYIRTRIAHSAALDHWFGGRSLWFADPVVAGGGSLFDLGCHTVDITRWLGGPPKAVAGRMNSFTGAYPDVDDNAAVVVEFESKALACMECAWVQRRGPAPMELYGTEGYAAIGTLAGRPVIDSTKVPADSLDEGRFPKELPAALPSPIDMWIAAILDDAPLTITVEDGRNLTELLEACYRSAQGNTAVTFPLD
jgi:1,5-anhydro-D-fructose reductase (1,5-anhydro-D-mannitol-forming)